MQECMEKEVGGEKMDNLEIVKMFVNKTDDYDFSEE